MLFLIFSPLFLIEFFVSGRFSIEVKYWKRKFNNLNKKKQQANQKKLKKKLSNHKLIWDLLYFHIITFPWKNIYEGISFSKICWHTPCNWWLGNQKWLEIRLKKIGAATTHRSNYYKSVHNNVNWKLNVYLKTLENSQTKTLGWNPLLQNLRSFGCNL